MNKATTSWVGTWWVTAVPAAAALVLLACQPEAPVATRTAIGAHPHAAQLWAAKCGACHVPVEPGTRGRAVIEAALRRHRARARLTELEWIELAEFLAPTRTTPGRTE